jgi:hypothetical protein
MMTVAHCLRLGESGSRIYRNGTWKEGPEPFGHPKASYSIAWKDGVTPRGVDQHFYEKLSSAWQDKSKQWLRNFAQREVGLSNLSPGIWKDEPIGTEELEYIKKWTVSTVSYYG